MAIGIIDKFFGKFSNKVKLVLQGEDEDDKKGMARWKSDLHEIIFESETFEGKIFDLVLLVFIIISTAIIVLESVVSINASIGTWLYILDWWVTISFTVEYILRLICVKNSRKYITSSYGIIDLLSILPMYLSVIFAQMHFLSVVRILRLLRVFRILKLGAYVHESERLVLALNENKRKIVVFLYFLLLTTLILGAFMYVFEHDSNKSFSNIPQSMYWAIVTLTTVGYGDVTPVTGAGKILSAGIMILGYSIISVTAGLVSAQYQKKKPKKISTEACPYCMAVGYEDKAKFCYKCGQPLNEHKTEE